MTATPAIRELPPHGPANMLDLYMTRYDYDYNRDPNGELNGDDDGAADRQMEDWVSGEVRNRPLFQHTDHLSHKTTYRVDYNALASTARLSSSRRGSELQRLVRAARGGEEDGMARTTGYAKEWYRPDLTRSHATADGQHPISIYKADYVAGEGTHAVNPNDVLHREGGGGEGSGNSVMYAGAGAVPYKADFLHVKGDGVIVDDGADIAPKITSKEALLPRGSGRSVASAFAPPDPARSFGLPVRRPRTNQQMPPKLFQSADGTSPNDEYTCTSWDYGDVSKAYPSQLPQPLEGSARADLLTTISGDTDVASLLRRLAGQQQQPGRAVRGAESQSWNEDDTNPIYLSPAQQKRCAVSRRWEEEGYVKQTIYKGDYVNQSRLPELPGNHGGPADVRDTCTNARATVGEMISGELTRTTRQMGTLRNSHGTLKTEAQRMADTERATASTVAAPSIPAELLTMMRRGEKIDAVDKADPHRHKLH